MSCIWHNSHFTHLTSLALRVKSTALQSRFCAPLSQAETSQEKTGQRQQLLARRLEDFRVQKQQQAGTTAAIVGAVAGLKRTASDMGAQQTKQRPRTAPLPPSACKSQESVSAAAASAAAARGAAAARLAGVAGPLGQALRVPSRSGPKRAASVSALATTASQQLIQAEPLAVVPTGLSAAVGAASRAEWVTR